MGLLIGLFLPIFLILLIVNLYFQRKKSPLQYFIPIGVIVVSLLIIGFVFLTDNLDNVPLFMSGFALFIGAAASFLVTAITHNMKDLKRSYWKDN